MTVPVASPPPAARGWRALPIRDRLTLWYAASVGVVLVVAGLVFRTVFAHALEREFDRSLEASAELARSFFRLELAEYRSPEATVAHLSTQVAFPDRRLEFVRPDGRVLAGTRTSPTLRGPTRRHDEPLDARRARGWSVRVVASTDPLVRPLRQVDALFLLGAPLGAVLAGVAGWWLAGRTLRPVADMAAATEHVRPGAGTRLPVGNPHDELGRLGTRFNTLLDRLDAALAQQRHFLADAAHELRTPVARTLSGVELALLDEAPSAGHVAALARARDDLRRTGRLVDELLQLARADARVGAGPHGAAQLARVYLDDVVTDALGPWRAAAQAAGVRLTQSALEEAPVDADPALVERLVGVLVDNAVRYTPAGGTVDVRVTCEGGAAVLAVVDTGIGLGAGEADRVTERFFRGAAARQRRPDGSGLGLAIARVVAEAHGAVLTLAAAPGSGTVARVAFAPLDASAVQRRARTP